MLSPLVAVLPVFKVLMYAVIQAPGTFHDPSCCILGYTLYSVPPKLTLCGL